MERKYFNIILWLLAGQVVGEVWHLFDSPKIHLVDWFLLPPKYLPDITWYVKGIGDEVSKIMWFNAMYLLALRINTRVAGVVACFIFFFIGELVLFFVNYKVPGYPYLYAITGIFLFSTLILKTKK